MVTCKTYTIEKAPTPGFVLTADQYEGTGPFTTNLHISYTTGAGQIVRIVNSDPIAGDSCLLQDITLDPSGNADVLSYSVTGTQVIYAILKTGTDAHNCCTDFNQTTCQYSNYIRLEVIVPPPVLTSVDISPLSPSLAIGASLTLTATPKDQNGNPMTGATITWNSGDTAKATVSPTTGSATTLTGVAIGTATITVNATIGVITVTNSTIATVTTPTPILTSVSISPSTPSIQIGDALVLTATPKDQNGSLMAGATVTWTSSDPTKGTVSPTGLTTTLTGITIGTTTITVNATIGVITVTNTAIANITIFIPVLTTIEISPPGATVAIGNTQQFTAIAKDQNSSIMTGVTITWAIGDPTKGSISTIGLFIAIAEGTPIITATGTYEGITKTGNAAVTITSAISVLSRITISPLTTSVDVGSGTIFTASTLDQFSNPIVATVAWTSSNPTIGTINQYGVFFALHAGTTMITATSGGIVGVALANVITVTAPTGGLGSTGTALIFGTALLGAVILSRPSKPEMPTEIRIVESKK